MAIAQRVNSVAYYSAYEVVTSSTYKYAWGPNKKNKFIFLHKSNQPDSIFMQDAIVYVSKGWPIFKTPQLGV